MTAKASSSAVMLQWGHGPKTVENHELEQSIVECAVLQWGHGPKTVENRSRCKQHISRGLKRAMRAGGLLEGNREHGKREVID